MLNPLDDYPVHQTAAPLAHPASGDLNHYDRYFFNGYSRDGAVYFGAAMGLYPNRGVVDAAFSVVRDGVQHAAFASAQAPRDRTRTEVGPIRVEVVEPLRVLRLRVAEGEHGVAADLLWRARTVAVEEPRFTRSDGTRLVMDYTRLTQWGTWEGWVTVDGERVDVDPASVVGSRDRSWGIRTVGERAAGGAPRPDPQFFWLWAPVNFDDVCTHFSVNEDGEGRRWHWSGAVIPLLAEGQDAWDPAPVETLAGVDHRVTWRPGTRRAERAEVVLRRFGGEEARIELEPIYDFQMLGIGYLHPRWSHGTWQGVAETGSERYVLADLDPLALQHLHVQALCRARWGEREGIGILEQLVIGVHAPSGFTGLLDGAATPQ